MSLLGLFEFTLIICASVLVLFSLIWVIVSFLKSRINNTVFKCEFKRLYIDWKKPVFAILVVKAGAIIIIGISVILTSLGIGQF